MENSWFCFLGKWATKKPPDHSPRGAYFFYLWPSFDLRVTRFRDDSKNIDADST
jgi:hypothetical protein